MRSTRPSFIAVATGAVITALTLASCGAGSRTAAETATQVKCDVPNPAQQTTINVLAYNSSAIDPFTNTMVKSCTKGNLSLKHEPIDFGGQVQKTVATLAGQTGTYDIVETYGFVIPELASAGKIEPLDDYLTKHGQKYGLDKLSENMKQVMTFEGKLYALPMQAQMFIMAYRKDVFDKLGLKPPTTFVELAEAGKKIQDAGEIKYPIAFPWLASADVVTSYDATLGALGAPMTDPGTMTANFDKPEAVDAFKSMLSLKPYMDPQVTTFDQPAVQQQMYNGSAAIAIMFSGRMNDLTLEKNSKYAKSFAFAPPPAVKPGGTMYNVLSVDGWSIPKNAQSDKDTLFQIIGSSVSEDASKAAIPAAYPAREGMVTDSASPFAAAANASIGNAPEPEPYPWTSKISNQITPIVGSVLLGKVTPEAGVKQMQTIADGVLADYK